MSVDTMSLLHGTLPRRKWHATIIDSLSWDKFEAAVPSVVLYAYGQKQQHDEDHNDFSPPRQENQVYVSAEVENKKWMIESRNVRLRFK